MEVFPNLENIGKILTLLEPLNSIINNEARTIGIIILFFIYNQITALDSITFHCMVLCFPLLLGENPDYANRSKYITVGLIIVMLSFLDEGMRLGG